MGVVYKARQKDLDRPVALKMILASHLASPEHIRRFQSEARAAARLRHSHIVPIHEVGQLAGQHYFTMEYIEGESLAERIARGPVHVQTAVRLLGAVARAVEHLHQQGIVHRDLKPSNILLDREGEPYVTDFGLAKVFVPGAAMTATGVIAGTPSYMAPEQASGRSVEVGPAADIYSLGAILYELLTGQPPFREENPLDTLWDVLGREPPLPRRLESARPPRAGIDLPEMPGQVAGRAVRLGGGAGRRPGAFRPPRAAAGPAAALGAAAGRLDAPPAGAGLAAGGVGRFLRWSSWSTITSSASSTTSHSTSGFRCLIAAWAVLSIVCQQFLDSRRWSIPARFVWGTLDSLVLLAGAAGGQRGGQPAGGRLSAVDRGLGAVVPGAFRLVHHGAVVAVLWGRGGGFLRLAAAAPGALRRQRQSPRDLRRRPGGAGIGGRVPGAAGAGA